MSGVMIGPVRKLPRGQLYLKPAGILADVVRTFRRRPERGSVIRAFEQAFAQELSAPHAIALPHARIALLQLLRVLNLPPGSEVLMTPVTIPEIVNVVLLAGLRPVFVDLGERTCNIDCDDLERKVTPTAKLILLTHLCGVPSDMTRVMDIARRHRLEVLEDCSQVPGTRFQGRTLGLFGRAGFMSLTPLKPVSTLYGGMVVTSDPNIDRELRRLNDEAPPPLAPKDLLGYFVRDLVLHGVTNVTSFSLLTHHVVRAGELLKPELIREFQRGNLFNDPAKRRRVVRLDRMPEAKFARYSDFQAATGFRALRELHTGNQQRRELSLLLHRLLTEANVPGLLQFEVDPDDSTFWRFPLWLDSADQVQALRKHLFARGIDSSPTNLECCSREEAFSEFNVDTPHARRFVDEMLFLPMHSNLTEADMHRIAEAVASFFLLSPPRRQDAASGTRAPLPATGSRG